MQLIALKSANSFKKTEAVEKITRKAAEGKNRFWVDEGEMTPHGKNVITRSTTFAGSVDVYSADRKRTFLAIRSTNLGKPKIYRLFENINSIEEGMQVNQLAHNIASALRKEGLYFKKIKVLDGEIVKKDSSSSF